MASDQQPPKNPFQETLNLPHTDFSIRANAQQKEPEILKRWNDEGLYQKATDKNKGKAKFILHDGPPYANGHLHIGHALSYILKDIVCKSKRMSGFHAPLVPGWDSHGLPIEIKVMTEKGLEKDREKVDRVTFKKYCRAFVQEWISIQDKELKELGKIADFQHPYITMSPGYEASILRAFATFVQKGHIERKLKTVPWCASCQTVLATAEIEYKDRKDPSIYVLFPLAAETARMTFPFLVEQNPDLKMSLAVWTTTPWTLPLNRAVVLNPTATYVVVQSKESGQAFIVAQELADKVCAEVGIEKIILAECDALALQGKKVNHPFIDGFSVPVILDESVQMGDGTACVHSAPGCGPEDYLLGVKNGLEIYSPLSADGKYIKGIMPASLEGIAIADAHKFVFTELNQKGTLLHKTSITHSYPHCWRCRNGLMFRATSQWFCDLSKNDLVKRALAEVEKITFIPERGQARLHSFIANRTEWCISRQRQWGVPIPAVMCDNCGWALLNADVVNAVADRVEKEGIEYWDRMTPQSLVADKILPENFACQECGNHDLSRFILERDILDVWFDSGVSSYAVLAQDKENLGVPADVYFEGSDQHRGWFQSSLLCGMVLYGHAPMRSIVTHGFILDEQKRKMSKSLGNVISPQDVMNKLSRDILRLWVASANFEDDLVISDKLLANITEMYKKIRNTSRFLIANLYDFDITKDAVEIDQLPAIDQYALAGLHELNKTVRAAYDEYHFSLVVQAINTYCTNDLSAVYLDILKDRLYVEKPNSFLRRAAQTTMYHILDVLTHLMAPVLSFLAEEISDFYQKDKLESIHLHDFSVPLDVWHHLASLLKPEQLRVYLPEQEATAVAYAISKRGQWTMLEALRTAVLKSIEVKREQGSIKHSYEATVTLWIDPTSPEYALMESFIAELNHKHEDVLRFFKDWFIVSQVVIAPQPTGLEQSMVPWAFVVAEHAQGIKCPRCWRWDNTSDADGLCNRCQNAVK
jgi:isoleucyl-tRNA synthetase